MDKCWYVNNYEHLEKNIGPGNISTDTVELLGFLEIKRKYPSEVTDRQRF